MDKQNQSDKLLGQVYQSATMGGIACDRLMTVVNNRRLPQELQRQKNGYNHIAGTAEVYLGMTGKKYPMESPIARYLLNANIGANLAASKNKAGYAKDMLIKGNIAGIGNMCCQLDDQPDCDSHVREIAGKLIRFEEQNILKLQQI